MNLMIIFVVHSPVRVACLAIAIGIAHIVTNTATTTLVN